MSDRVKGFRFAGVHAGIKSDGALDMGLIAAETPVDSAGVFTRNLVRAAPVELSARRLRGGTSQAVLVNSGNANACTGSAGRDAALTLSGDTAKALRIRRPACAARDKRPANIRECDAAFQHFAWRCSRERYDSDTVRP